MKLVAILLSIIISTSSCNANTSPLTDAEMEKCRDMFRDVFYEAYENGALGRKVPSNSYVVEVYEQMCMGANDCLKKETIAKEVKERPLFEKDLKRCEDRISEIKIGRGLQVKK